MRKPLIGALLGVLLVSAALRAQSLEPLQHVLKSEDVIIVLDTAGDETRGKVVTVSPTSLEIIPLIPTTSPGQRQEIFSSGVPRTFPVDKIAAVIRSNINGGNSQILYGSRDSFGDLQRRLKPNQIIRVTEINGQTTTGRATQIAPTTLVIAVRKENPRDGSGRPRYEWTDVRSFRASDVQRVSRPGPIWDGAVKGALVGLIPALILTSSCDGCYGNAQAAGLMIGIGAGIGLGIDAAFGPKTLYRARVRR